MPSRYTFTTYSPEWPREFAREAERLQALLGEEMITIHHIGSTSVPGLEAKPIIDLMPLVHDITRIDGYTDAMTAAGYTAWGEHGLPGRRYFTKDAGEVRTHNAHIYGVDNPEVVRHLAFCTYLRAHPDACTEYVAIKRTAYAQHPADIQADNDYKNAWIKRMEGVAIAWYQEQQSNADVSMHEK